jgi:hypothetical protein
VPGGGAAGLPARCHGEGHLVEVHVVPALPLFDAFLEVFGEEAAELVFHHLLGVEHAGVGKVALVADELRLRRIGQRAGDVRGRAPPQVDTDGAQFLVSVVRTPQELEEVAALRHLQVGDVPAEQLGDGQQGGGVGLPQPGSVLARLRTVGSLPLRLGGARSLTGLRLPAPRLGQDAPAEPDVGRPLAVAAPVVLPPHRPGLVRRPQEGAVHRTPVRGGRAGARVEACGGAPVAGQFGEQRLDVHRAFGGGV